MYTLPKNERFVVTEGMPSEFQLLLNDRPSLGGQELLAEYLKDARDIFKTECDILLSTDRAFTALDAERLTIMLKLLTDARRTWQEEEAESKRLLMED